MRRNNTLWYHLLSWLLFFHFMNQSVVGSDDTKRCWLGATVRQLTDKQREILGVPDQFGVRIETVVPGGPAGLAGIQPNDVVILAGGIPVTDAYEFVMNVGKQTPEATWTLNVIRSKEELTVDITMKIRPSEEELNRRLEKMAENGDLSACYSASLPLIHSHSAEDRSRGAEYLRRAADAKHHRAMALLGWAYLGGLAGRVVEQDVEKGRQLLDAARDAGEASAVYYLAMTHLYGLGVNENETLAFTLLNECLDEHILDSGVPIFHELGRCHYNGWGTVRDYTEAVAYFRRSAEQENANSQRMLGNCYHNGHGVDKDLQKAFTWFLRAARQKDLTSIRAVGNAYMHGHGVEQNQATALEWYLKGEELNCPDCITNVGFCYSKGLGVPVDKKKGAEYFHKAALLEQPVAIFNFGIVLLDGNVYRQDYAKARAWLERAEKMEYLPAIVAIGDMERDGLGTPKNRQKAIEYYLRARDQGYEIATERLKELGVKLR